MNPLCATTYWNVFLSDDQTYFGRLVISLKRECASLPDISGAEQSELFSLFAALERFFKQEYKATMFNYTCLMNNAYRDGETPHVHWHFRPRYEKPITVDGTLIADPNFGNHYIPTVFGQKDTVPEFAKTELVEKLKKISL